MGRPTFIGITGRSYTEPKEEGIPYLCAGCNNPFLAKERMKYPCCKICLVVEAEHGKANAKKHTDKEQKRRENNERARAMNPAWNK